MMVTVRVANALPAWAVTVRTAFTGISGRYGTCSLPTRWPHGSDTPLRTIRYKLPCRLLCTRTTRTTGVSGLVERYTGNPPPLTETRVDTWTVSAIKGGRGVYNSAVMPPATRTRPSGSSVAVWPVRGVV